MVPFLDLKRQYREIKSEIDAAVLRTLESCQFILGPEVAAFEEEFASYCGSAFAVACNSGTSALHLALLAAGIGPGDEVITVPYTFIATTAAIRYTGATPVFVDIDPVTFNMAPERIEAAITPRTRAILPVHLFGHPADMTPIVEIARRRGLVVIEDAAQAHGAEYRGQRVGSIGDLGCFSFYPGKNLGAYGEGGLVTTSNPEYNRLLRMLRDWGSERRYHHTLRGYNYRMEGLQGAILRVKFRYLEQWIAARRAHAEFYNRRLADVVEVPTQAADCRHVYGVYAVRSDRRDQLASALAEAGVQTVIYYPIPVHLSEAHADLGYSRGSFPVTEECAGRQLSLPVFPELTMDELETVCSAITGLNTAAAS